MRLTTFLCLTALLLAPIAASADEGARTIELPPEGLSLAVPAGWEIHQYGPATLKLSKGKAMLWFYMQEAAREDASANLRRMADRVAAEAPDGEKPKLGEWIVTGAAEAAHLSYVEADQHRLFGVIERSGLPGFDVEATWPPNCPKAVRDELLSALASIDVTPYEDPARFVGWALGFTLDGVGAWKATADDGGGVKFQPTSGPRSAIRVQTAPGSSSDPVARLDRVIEAALGRVRQGGIQVTPGPLERFERTRPQHDAIPGVRTTLALAKDGAAIGTLVLEAALDGDLALTVVGAGEGLERAQKIARTFRAGTDPGPRKAAGLATPDRFPTDRGPKIRFTLPSTWGLSESTSKMRLATFHPTRSLTGVAYFFDGGGGSLDANLERWKGQWQNAESKERTIESKDGKIRTTVLDITGTSKDGERGFFVYIDVEGGPVTLKMTGSNEVLGAEADEFYAWLESFELGS